MIEAVTAAEVGQSGAILDDDDEDLATFSFSQAIDAFVAVFVFLTPFLARHRGSIAVVLVGLLIETAFNVAMPVSLKVLIDNVLTGEHDRGWMLITILGGLGLAGIFTSIVAVVYERIDARVSSDIVGDIRAQLFAHTQSLSAAFYSRMNRGDLLSRFSVDMAALETIVLQGVDAGALPILELGAAVLLLFVLNWKLALIAMLVFPIVLIGPRVIAPYAIEAAYDVKEGESSTLSLIQEIIGAQFVVKAFGLQPISRLWFGRRNDAVRASMRRASFSSTMVERSVTIAILLLHLVMFGVGAYLTFDQSISLGTFVTFENVFWELSYNVSRVMQFTPQVIRGSAAALHMEEVLDSVEREGDIDGAPTLSRLGSAIEFENVSFGYENEQRQLADVSFTIPAGRQVAIVGPSGAGKSTILSLMLRLYRPTKGRITIDGIDIADVSLDSLRSQIAIVFQENLLFNTTLRENIRLGRLDATDSEVEDAADQARIHRWIVGLPQGYETRVSERGDTLSGGQRQRIAIARALLRNPAILLLDEATSALDQTTEAKINRVLKRITTERTVMWITHRLSAAADMDEIMVMADGCLVEQGSHAQLLAAGGQYSRLWLDQDTSAFQTPTCVGLPRRS